MLGMQDRLVPLYTAAAVRDLDRKAIEEHGIAGIELMQRAGAAAFRALQTRWPAARRCVVACGAGNNGGDGYVIARLAARAGLQVTVLAASDPGGLRDAAAQSFAQWARAGGITVQYTGEPLPEADVLVDALLGTGLDRPVEGRYATLIEALDQHPAPVLAVDVPSGLSADSGRVMGRALRAELTISFIGRKRGLYTSDGPDHAGYRLFDGLGVPASTYDGVAVDDYLMTPLGLAWPSRRPLNAHKGQFGHLLVVGGGPGMAGAARMAGTAALRSGAGLVTVACHPDSAAAINGGQPELMVGALSDPRQLGRFLRRADVLAVGPGLGQSDWARTVLGRSLDAQLPTVLDADALNLLAQDPSTRRDWILTPHPGEAARLLEVASPAVQDDRFAAVRALQGRYGGTVVLKGRGTLVACARGETLVCDHGHPAMASAGMGDVLTGVIAGLYAQGMPPDDAASLGVWLHAMAGERAAHGGPGLLASDLIGEIRALLDGGGSR
jgi:hydroxyethylthiazole kinase-like uncharacterized protein yjeF